MNKIKKNSIWTLALSLLMQRPLDSLSLIYTRYCAWLPTSKKYIKS